MPPRRIGIEIDRIVLEGVDLDAADIEMMRAAVIAELNDWLSGVDPSTLRAGATPRVAPQRQIVASLADGRVLARTVAHAVRDAVEPGGPAHQSGGPARSSLRQGFRAQGPADSGGRS